MANGYKVPQDVEADDKLIGPFSFRQFVYLMIVALSLFLGWGLAQLFVPLAVIILPVVIFFGALALPLRKDQPMEIYMAAMVSFYLKPHKRLWDPDGIDSLIEITVPKVVEVKRSKSITKGEAERRLSYLAEIVDTQGWAVRGPGVQAPNSALNSDIYFEAQQVHDVLDSNDTIAQSFDNKLGQSDARRHDEMVEIMAGKSTPATSPAAMTNPIPAAPAPIPSPSNYFGGDAPTDEPPAAPEPPSNDDKPDDQIEFNPYPNIQQAVLQPADMSKQAAVTPPLPTTSEKAVPAGIINLASNTDLSIEAIAREANRIQKKEDPGDGVYISLR